MKAFSAVVVANSWVWVELHRVTVHMVVGRFEVVAVESIVAATHKVEVAAAVRVVMTATGSAPVVALHRMTSVVHSSHNS